MTFREQVALSLSPLLLRLAIGVTFVWFGWGKFQEATFTGPEAAQLIQLGIGKTASGAADSLPAGEDAETESATPEGGDDDATTPDEGDDATAAQADPAVPATTDAVVTARRFNSITLMLDRAGHPYPRIFAMIAAITELAGGALLVIGLFTRIWSLGLAIAMGYAFYFTSLGALGGWSAVGKTWLTNLGNMPISDQSTLFFQVVLLAGSLALFFGSAGTMSADRILFRPSSDEDDDE